MRRTVQTVLVLLFLALPCLLLLPRLRALPALTPRELDQVQAARYTAAQRRLGTLVIRPLEVGRLSAYGDGALPDLGHAPLYTGLAALTIERFHQQGAGDGQRAIAILGLTLLLGSGLVCLLLARRLFPKRPPARATFFFLWGTGAIGVALQPNALLLGAIGMGLLIAALLPLDVRHTENKPPLGWALLAGVLWGALFLSLYSTLILLPVLLFHIGRVTRRHLGAIAVFLVAAGAVAAPQLYRAYKFAGNPLYHTRLYEGIMRTTAYPGEQLYHAVSLPRSLGSYLADGGVVDVLSKVGHTLTDALPRAGALLGLPLVLWLASGWIRFTDPRVNGLRNLLFCLVPLHLLGACVFLPADEAAASLLIYGPALAVLGGQFLELVIRARRLPRWHAQGAFFGWSAVACLPGITALLWQPLATFPSALYAFPQGTARHAQKLITRADAIIASSEPAETAFQTALPTALLPASAADFVEVGTRIGKPIVAFALLPTLRWDSENTAVLHPWAETYRKVIGLYTATEALPRDDRERFRQEIVLKYPPAIIEAVRTFQATAIRESELGDDYSAWFWDLRYTQAP